MFVFVIMPFKVKGLYENIIKPTLEAEGCTVERGDTHVTQQNVIRRILEQVEKADLVIADLTGKNPNVFYELALAHAFWKPTFVITQDSLDRIPFDLKSYDTYRYSLEFDKVDDLKNKLRQHIVSFNEGKLKPANPVTDFLPLSKPGSYISKVENGQTEYYKSGLEQIDKIGVSALILSSKNIYLLEIMSRISFILGNTRRAIHFARILCNESPNDFAGYGLMAQAYEKENDWINVLHTMESALKKIKTEREYVYHWQATAQENLGQIESALKAYELASEIAAKEGNYKLRDKINTRVEKLRNK